MGVFIGLDVSLSKTAVCVVDHDGAVLWQGKVPSEPGPLIARLGEWSGVIDLAGIEASESPTRIQEMAPTLAAANALYERRLAEAAKGDANDALWAIEAIRDYNPEPDLDKIKAQVLLINDAEDHANPPELGTVERAMKRVKYGLYVLIPAGPNTHGHFSHFYAELWKPYLIEFMKTLHPPLAAATG